MVDEDMIARIQRRLSELGTNPNAASEAAGLGRDYIRNILDGKSRNPKTEHILKLSRALKCRMEWLLTGEGLVEDLAPAIEGLALRVLTRVELEFKKRGVQVLLTDDARSELIADIKKNHTESRDADEHAPSSPDRP